MPRWCLLLAAVTLFLIVSAGGLRGVDSLASLVTTLGFFGVAGVLWFRPGGMALWLSRKRTAWPRRIYWLGAVVAFAPVLLLEVTSVVDAFRRYDGFCHHAPDIRYPCSMVAVVLDALFPASAFALFGALMLGVPAFAIGALATGVAHWFAESSCKRKRASSS